MEQLHAQIRLVDELGKKVIAILQDYDQSFPYAQLEGDDETASEFVRQMRELVKMIDPPPAS
jgi:hypothetical protein